MPAVQWKVFLASATGKQHLDANTPCQDCGHGVVANGGFAGVVCDGAGSASHGHEGAQFLAQRLVASLAQMDGSALLEPDRGRAALLNLVAAARAELEALALQADLTLRDFACTLVGCVTGADGGCFFHVGDGFAIHMNDAGDCVLSPPENGEFADETYFVTDEAWREHLRVTPLGAVRSGDVIGLMSDGAAPFAVNRPRTGFFRPFIDPVRAFLCSAGEVAGNQALHGVLADEKTHAITGDDKTLLLALAG